MWGAACEIMDVLLSSLLSRCGVWVPEHTDAVVVWHMDLFALWHMGF